MKKITIIEGTDAVGKTTLVSKLREQHEKINGENTCHIVHEDGNTDYDFFATLKRTQDADILDRSLIGELVWSVVFNREPRLSFGQVKAILNILKNQGFELNIILKTTDVENIYATLVERNETIAYDPIEVYELFREVLEDLGVTYTVMKDWK